MKHWKARLTVEAAIVLPLFVFFSMALLAPIGWLDTQRRVQMNLERTCEELSLYAYLDEDADALMDEDSCMELEVEYKEDIPFFSTFLDVTMRAASKRRSWIGLDGKLEEIRIGENAESVHGEMVYITENMERYHRYRDCRHLENVSEAVSVLAVGAMRNQDGTIYRPCDRCMEGHSTQDTVYITRWGDHYHASRSCSSMSNYIRKVPLYTVVHLGECNACRGKKIGEAYDD